MELEEFEKLCLYYEQVTEDHLSSAIESRKVKIKARKEEEESQRKWAEEAEEANRLWVAQQSSGKNLPEAETSSSPPAVQPFSSELEKKFFNCLHRQPLDQMELEEFEKFCVYYDEVIEDHLTLAIESRKAKIKALQEEEESHKK